MLGIAHIKYVHFEPPATQIENLLTLASPSHMKDEVSQLTPPHACCYSRAI